jgi:4-hydroxybenzoate polyprenyltransferase
MLENDGELVKGSEITSHNLLRSLLLTLRMIKIEHSIFALPFALMSALIAARGIPSVSQIVWILIAMVSARSCAMAFNRLADRKFDHLNPRTKNWPLAAGALSTSFVTFFVLFCSAIFIYSAYRLNRLAFLLSPVALLIILFYSLTKRFTILSHWFIGLALAVAPAGAWVAIRGTLDFEPLLLSLAILFWTAGFDLIYSCQDAEFDRTQNLFSIPARYGIRVALLFSSFCHVVTVIFIFLFGYFCELGAWYFVGCAIVAAMLLYEHTLVSPKDLSRVNEAFFTVNGLISVLLLLFTSLDLFL